MTVWIRIVKKVLPLFFLLSLFFQVKAADVNYTAEDKIIFDKYISVMQQKRELPVQDLIIETALFFLGTPYIASTLEKEPEQLVINLREMDCSTFIENVFSLVKTLGEENPTFEVFSHHLQTMRYRKGMIEDYTDRLHYTSDWVFENEKKGLVKDITREIGGEYLPLTLSFMSTHPDSYRQLKNNPDRINTMQEKEKEINNRTYYYIPKANIDQLGRGMQNGDMVGFVTAIKGLDLSHTGIIYWKEGRLTFIHASSTLKKVVVNEGSLASYAEGIKSNKGIMVIRSQM